MSKAPVFVYTAIVGNYDEPPRIRQAPSDVEFVLVSDQPQQQDPWQVVPIDRYWSDDKLTAGFVKTHPEFFIPPDATAVWIDANLDEIQIDPDRVHRSVSEASVATLSHLLRSSVREEAAAVVHSHLDTNVRVRAHVDRLGALGFPDDLGLSATMLVIRDLRDPRVRLFNHWWWDFILSGSRRDQLGFDAASWVTGVSVHRLDMDWREPNEWFHRQEHSRGVGRQIDVEIAEVSLRGFNLSGLPELYPIPHYFDEEWSSRDIGVNQALNRAVVASGEDLEGNYSHMHRARIGATTPPDPRRSWKREYLRRAVAGIGSYLEVGFNAGHSTAIVLSKNPVTQVSVVDIDNHKYVRPCVDILTGLFPGRVNCQFGDSRALLDATRGYHASDFDLVHIDGGHGGDVFLSDIQWWLSTSRSGNKLLVDDAYVAHIARSLDEQVRQGSIRESDPGLPSSGENRLYIRV